MTSRGLPNNTQGPEDNKEVRKPEIRTEMILWLRAIIRKCEAIIKRKDRTKKTIATIFYEILDTGKTPTLEEIAVAWEIKKERMRTRIRDFRKDKGNVTTVPYPTRDEFGRWVYSCFQTRREYEPIRIHKARVQTGSQEIEQRIIAILSQGKKQRERALKAQMAQIEAEIAEGQLLLQTPQVNKKKRKAVVSE